MASELEGVVKGYAKMALDDIALFGGEELSEEQRQAFFDSLDWAVNRMTATDALEYFYEN